jgi:dUTP pyrophosphatase
VGVPVLIKVKLIDGFMPERQSEGAAGWDLRAAEDAVIYGNGRVKVRLGVCVEIPPGYEGHIRSRSGLAAKEGIQVLNSPGTIDCDYRGELLAILNRTNEGGIFRVTKGDRVCQLVINEIPSVEMERVEELSASVRGEGGLGSTGVK